MIASPKFKPTNGSCVSFWYYMRGLDSNEYFSFSIRNDITYMIGKGDTGPFWKGFSITLPSSFDWHLNFSIYNIKSTEGLIAIDDISVDFDRKCYLIGFCDFEVKSITKKVIPYSGSGKRQI